MAVNVYWVGAAPVSRDTLSFACAAPTAGLTYSVSYNERTVAVIAADTSAANLAAALSAAITASSDPRIRDGSPTVSSTTLTVQGPTDGAPLTSPAGSTSVVLTRTPGTGPYHADNVLNYQTALGPNQVDQISMNIASTGGNLKLNVVKPDGSAVVTGNAAWNATDATYLASINAALDAATGVVGGIVATAIPATDTDLGIRLTYSGAGYSGRTWTAATVNTFPTSSTIATYSNITAGGGASGLPANGDTLVFDRGTALDGPRYALYSLAGVTLAGFVRRDTFIGRIGLPNYRQTYTEFRPKYFQTKASTFLFYASKPEDDQQFKIQCTLATAVAWVIQGTGTTGTNGLPLEVTGLASTSTVVITNYGIGVGIEPGNTVVCASINATNSNVKHGIGATTTTLNLNGGTLANGGTITTANLRDTTAIYTDAGNSTTINQSAGSIVWQSTAAPTTFTSINAGSIDYSKAGAILALPTTTIQAKSVVRAGGRITRPWSVVLDGCSVDDVILSDTPNQTVTIT